MNTTATGRPGQAQAAPAATSPAKAEPKKLTPRQTEIARIQALKAKDKASVDELVKLKTLNVEEKKSTLARLASHRVQNAMNVIRTIGNLGAYKPTEGQTKKVFDALKEAIEVAYSKWSAASQDVKDEGFTLSPE